MRKIAIFDFCETIVDFQSADAFVRFVIANEAPDLWTCSIDILRRLLIKSRIIELLQIFDTNSYINKRMLLYEIKGKTKERLNSLGEVFLNEMIIPHYIPEVIDKIKEYQGDGWEVCIISGGYDIYLNHVRKQLNIDHLLCTRLLFSNNYFMGSYDGNDCLGKEKVVRVIDYFGAENFDKMATVFFSDSFTDLPMFQLCKKGVVVCRGQVSDWMKSYDLEVLLCQG